MLIWGFGVWVCGRRRQILTKSAKSAHGRSRCSAGGLGVMLGTRSQKFVRHVVSWRTCVRCVCLTWSMDFPSKWETRLWASTQAIQYLRVMSTGSFSQKSRTERCVWFFSDLESARVVFILRWGFLCMWSFSLGLVGYIFGTVFCLGNAVTDLKHVFRWGKTVTNIWMNFKTLCSPCCLWFLRPKQGLITSLHLGKLVQMTLFWSFSGLHRIIRGIGLISAVFTCGESAHEGLSVPIDTKCLWLENCRNKISKTVTTGMFCSCTGVRRDGVHAFIMQNTRPCCC